MTAARYDLSEFVASFDFYDWLVMVQALGATEIVFDIDKPKTTKWPADVVLRRFRSIIEPGPALAGLPYRFGSDGEAMVSPHMREILQWVSEGNTFRRLSSVKPPGTARYTVTLRNDSRIPSRNSDEVAWRGFADEIEAVVIEDFDDAPMHLNDRVTLYAGAEMNFGVVNGPMHLITLTDYPAMMVVNEAAQGGFLNLGMKVGDQYPWCRANQRLVWIEDDLPSLRRAFREWRNRQ